MAKKQNRDRRLRLYYTAQEYELVKGLTAQSNHRTVSGYVRQVSLQKPVIVAVRNRSFDTFIDEIIVLRKEMGTMMERPVLSFEQRKRLVGIQEEIKTLIHRIAESCTPKSV